MTEKLSCKSTTPIFNVFIAPTHSCMGEVFLDLI